VTLLEKKKTHNSDAIAGLIAEPTESTGIGLSLTSVDPLPTS